jgi:hypothetical protein
MKSSLRLLLQILLFTLLLTGCQNQMITNLIVQPGGILYKDDFSNPSSGLPILIDKNGSEYYSGGSYHIEIYTSQYSLWAFPAQTYNDVRVEEDAVRISGPDANRFGIICRFRDPSNFYFFIISSDGYYAIGKTLNNTTSMLGQETMVFSPSILQGSLTNHIRFDCIGNSLTGYVNDQVLASAVDGDFSTGSAGLLAGTFDIPGVKIAFDNFMVIKP